MTSNNVRQFGQSTQPPGPISPDRGVDHVVRLREDFLGFVGQLSQQFGDCVHYRVGLMPVYQFTHPDQYHEVLVTKSRSFKKTDRFKGVFGRWLGNGLLLDEGDSWAEQRRVVQPFFLPQKIPSYAETIVRQTNRMIDECCNREVDVVPLLQRMTLVTTGQLLFKTDLSEIANQFVEEVSVMQRMAYADFTKRSIAAIAERGDHRSSIGQSVDFMNNVVDLIVAERQQTRGERDDILTALLAASGRVHGTRIVDHFVRDATLMLLLAGTSTTATAITWALFALARHRDVQERVMVEVDTVLDGQPASGDSVGRLRFAENVFFESMRLYPPAYTTSRQSIEPVEIGGYRLPLGAQVHLVPWLTHRDPRWFPKPHEFRPGRFRRDARPTIPRFGFIPFGAGPRACIGGGLALMQSLLVIATTLQRCGVSLGGGQIEPELEPLISLQPKSGLRLRFSSRNEGAVQTIGATA